MKALWGRAALVGLPVGLLQVAINQGDRWIAHSIDAGVVFKSVLTPLVSVAVALAAGALMRSQWETKP
jgi:hypothetical protein